MKNLFSKEEKLVKIIRWLFLLKGILFLIFAGVHIFRGAGIIAGLFFIDGIVSLWLNRVINKKKRWIFWFAVIFIGVNIFLTITDEFGVVDFFILLLESILFIMVLGNKRRLILK